MRRIIAAAFVVTLFGLPAAAAMVTDATARFCILCPW
jgi:hypothetical protein